MKHFLLEAIEKLPKGIYFTPKKIQDKITSELIIKNPPYAIRERNSKNIK